PSRSSHTVRPGISVPLGPDACRFTSRSSSADWAAEHDYPQVLREMGQAHTVSDSVEQAYRHSTRLNKKREMMSAWSDFALADCSPSSATSSPLNRVLGFARLTMQRGADWLRGRPDRSRKFAWCRGQNTGGANDPTETDRNG